MSLIPCLFHPLIFCLKCASWSIERSLWIHAFFFTRLSLNTILGQTFAAVVFARNPRVTNDSQLLLATPPVGFFHAWNGNSLILGAFTGSVPSLYVILTNGNMLGGVHVNLQTLADTVPSYSDRLKANNICPTMCLVKWCQCKMVFRFICGIHCTHCGKKATEIDKAPKCKETMEKERRGKKIHIPFCFFEGNANNC